MKAEADQKKLSLRAWATASVLIALSLSEMLVHLAGIEQSTLIARISFLTLCILLAGKFGFREWVLFGLSIAFAAGLYLRPNGQASILFALDRAAFFAAFIYLVTLLKEAALRSTSVLKLGQYITQQPTGRRYYALAGGSHFMGVLLNFGAISLLAPLILRGARAATNDVQKIAIADQQQISALIRGFAWMIMWSPTALTQAVLFAAFPSINLGIVMALGIGASITMILIGHVEHRVRWQNVAPTGFVGVMEFPTRAAKRFSIICALIISMTFLAMWLLDVSAALGLMLVAPLMMITWIFEQELGSDGSKAFKKTGLAIGGILTGSADNLGRSAFTLGAAGFIGEAAARLLPVSSIADALHLGAMPDWLFLMALPVIITLGGQIALSPILIVVFISAVLNQLPFLPADPNLIVFSLGAGWAMSMTASPNASATLLISGVTGVAPTTLTWRWNGIYALMCYVTFSLSFVILTQLFPV